MPQLQIFSQVRSKEGIILFESAEEGHSWTWNAYNLYTGFMLDVQMEARSAHSPSLFTTDRLIMAFDGSRRSGVVNRSSNYNNYHFQNRNLTAGIDQYGLMVGSDDTPFEIDDISLFALIPHGNTSGCLLHSVMPNPITTWDEATNRFYADYTRFFNNNSGDTITVKEIGLASANTVGGSTGYYYLTRDVLEAPIEVPDGGRVTFIYRIWSFPYDEVIAKMPTRPDLGTAGNGGYCMGGRFGNALDTIPDVQDGYAYPNQRYLMILAPAASEVTGVNYQSPAVNLTQNSDNINYGWERSEYLVGQPTSQMGAALAAYRTATGDPNWYIPSCGEMLDIWDRQAYLPAGQELATSTPNYATATPKTTDAYMVSVTTGAGTGLSQTSTSRRVRFMKRIHRDDWSPD